MPEASDQQMSHPDRHDLDKLARWKSGLDAADVEAESFPACAIFLVSPEDRLSHDIFRRYRSVFEELGGGFHHLVIFGQHGISTTQIAFLSEVGFSQKNVPLLAIAPMSKGSAPIYCVELPKGDRSGDLDDSQTWGAALESVRESATQSASLALGDVGGIATGALHRGSLAGTIDGVLKELGG